MTNRLSLDMLKATRLTRAGRLVEATEFLQQLLRGEAPPEVTDSPDVDFEHRRAARRWGPSAPARAARRDEAGRLADGTRGLS